MRKKKTKKKKNALEEQKEGKMSARNKRNKTYERKNDRQHEEE